MTEKNLQKVTIALNVLHVTKEENIYLAYIPKTQILWQKQFNLLVISIGEGWHYLTETWLHVLFRGTTSTRNGDVYCLSFLHSLRAKSKFEKK